jgi:hypothetical protein
MPIGGGEARALTSGWRGTCSRVQPDGQWIAFTSDRGGGDNVWVIPRGGGEAKQVTKEDFRLVNSPVWSPDGNYIAVRKHFTKHRSLGSGEIWLYHVSGGKGVQMTEKPNDQKDVGEPAFSPDGQALCTTARTHAGLDLRVQQGPVRLRSTRSSGSSGTAADREAGRRPRRRRPADAVARRQVAGVHPPGRRRRQGPGQDDADRARPGVRGRAAGVRRARPRHAGDLGDPRGLSGDRVGRPTAASWCSGPAASCGASARGRQTRPAAGEVPFHVPRRARSGAGGALPGRGRAARVRREGAARGRGAPDGKRVVYQALGHLYVRTLPEGQPKRLTKQSDHFEQDPAFSRDGKQIVFTTWDDQALGSVRTSRRRAARSGSISHRSRGTTSSRSSARTASGGAPRSAAAGRARRPGRRSGDLRDRR